MSVKIGQRWLLGGSSCVFEIVDGPIGNDSYTDTQSWLVKLVSSTYEPVGRPEEVRYMFPTNTTHNRWWKLLEGQEAPIKN